MTEVYLVIETEPYENDYIHGAFDSREKAEELQQWLIEDMEKQTGVSIEDLLVSYVVRELEIK